MHTTTLAAPPSQRRHIPQDRNAPHSLRGNDEAQTAFLVALLGGTGFKAGYYVRPNGTDAPPFPMTIVQLDTDPISGPWVDRRILIPMTPAKLEAVVSNPALFGDVAAKIIEHHHRFLDPEDLGNGSRGIRLLSQLAFIYHMPEIRAGLRDAILDLYKQGVGSIIPVFVSSSGGGAGSALQILTAIALKDPGFRNRLMEGLPHDVLRTPISFAVEPFGYCLRHRDAQANMVLSNCFSFRIESAVLEAQKALRYVVHIGLANSHGVVLDSPEEIAKVLGTCVYEFLHNWANIKSMLVNNVDLSKLFRRYLGTDIPEIVLGDVLGNSTNSTSTSTRISPNGN